MNNPILKFAYGIFEFVSPGSLTNPEKALRKVVKTLGWIRIEKTETISVRQIKDLQQISYFNDKNLVQIKKLMQSESPRIGPEPKRIAKFITIPELKGLGFSATFVPLTEEERSNELSNIDGFSENSSDA